MAHVAEPCSRRWSSMSKTTAPDEVVATTADFVEARAQVRSSSRGVVSGSLVGQLVVQIIMGAVLLQLVPSLSGMGIVVGQAFVTVAVLAPMVVVLAHVGYNKSAEKLAASLAREREFGAQARRRDFETRLSNALEMSHEEDKIVETIGRALNSITGDSRVEILLADNSQAHMGKALVSGTDPEGPGCMVESPELCVAARRGQTQTFTDSDALDACPYLQNRTYGACSAACVPISIMGRTVGVVHLAEPTRGRLPSGQVDQLEVLANQFGARLGMWRGAKESQIQASTDDLTGLLNRRAFENQVRRLRQGGKSYSVVMADLDHFKLLNDSHGHEAGDRALRLFVNVLQSMLRPIDIACRYGGEESLLVCERIREALALSLQSGTSPVFTSSFGVMEWDGRLTLEQLVANADAALYQAKAGGRNRAVLFDAATTPAGSAGAKTITEVESAFVASMDELSARRA